MKFTVTLLSALLILTGCVTGERDSGGRGMQLTQATEIEFSATDLDIPLYLGDSIASVTQVVRDNAAPIDTYNLGDKGSIRTQRVSAFFGDKTQEQISSRENFIEQLNRVTSGRSVADNQITAITHNGNKRPIGYKAVYSQGTNKCLYANTGYRMRGLTIYSNETGNADTIIDALICGDEKLVAAASEMLSNVVKVDDREAYARALAKT
ncbi:MAG: hypothetical protein RIC36_09750 [Rhodospirillales bacterium]